MKGEAKSAGELGYHSITLLGLAAAAAAGGGRGGCGGRCGGGCRL